MVIDDNVALRKVALALALALDVKFKAFVAAATSLTA